MLVPFVVAGSLLLCAGETPPTTQWTPRRQHPCAAEIVPLEPCRVDPERGESQYWCSPGSIDDEAWSIPFSVRPLDPRSAASCAYDIRVSDDRHRSPTAKPDEASLHARRALQGLQCAVHESDRRCRFESQPWKSLSVAVFVEEPALALVAPVVLLKVYRPDGVNIRGSALVGALLQLLGFGAALACGLLVFRRTLARDRRLLGQTTVIAALGAAGMMVSGVWSEMLPVDLGGFDARHPSRLLFKLPLWSLFGAVLCCVVVAGHFIWRRLGPGWRVVVLAALTAFVTAVGPMIQIFASAWKVAGPYPVLTPRFVYYAAFSLGLALPLVMLHVGPRDGDPGVGPAARAAVRRTAVTLGNSIVVLLLVWFTSPWSFPRDPEGFLGLSKPLSIVGHTLLALPAVFGISLALAWIGATPACLSDCDQHLTFVLDEVDRAAGSHRLRLLLIDLLRITDIVAAVPPGRRLALGYFVPRLLNHYVDQPANLDQLAGAIGELPTRVEQRLRRLAEALALPPEVERRLPRATIAWSPRGAADDALVHVTVTLVPDPAHQSGSAQFWVWDRSVPGSPALRDHVDLLLRRLLGEDPALSSKLMRRLRARQRLVVSFTHADLAIAQHDLGYELPLALVLLQLVGECSGSSEVIASGLLLPTVRGPEAPLEWTGSIRHMADTRAVAVVDREQARSACARRSHRR